MRRFAALLRQGERGFYTLDVRISPAADLPEKYNLIVDRRLGFRAWPAATSGWTSLTYRQFEQLDLPSRRANTPRKGCHESPAKSCESSMRSIATRTSTRKSSSRGSRLRWSRPPRSTTAKKPDIVVKIDREDGSISGTHDGAPLDSGRNGRPHRRPNRQAGDDPEDSRGRARRPVRRIHTS